MKNFDQFKLEQSDVIFGGELHNTYVGRYGDLYDDVEKRYIFFESEPS